MHKYIRYSAPKDNELIQEFIKEYDILVANAHISSYYTKSLSKFFYQNSAKYIIDPRTFIFQLSPSELFDKNTNDKISASYKKLFDRHYSSTVIKQFLSRPTGFSVGELEINFSELFAGAISSQIFGFQNTEYDKYLSPAVLIAPSFALLKDYNESDIAKVLQLNMQSIEKCKEKYDIIFDIGSILILDKEILLKENTLQRIIDHYSSSNVSYIYLWIDDFNGFRSENNILKAYKVLVNGLNRHKIIDLYADYSSFMLCSEKSPAPMHGICITAGYNESRTIRGVKGMSPAAKYYMRDIHTRFPPAEFQRILAQREYFDESIPTKTRAERFYNEICDCTVCREVIDKDINNIIKFTQVITTKGGRQQSAYTSLILAQRHFLYAKLMEVTFVENNNYSTLWRQLEDALLDYAGYGFTGLQGVGYWLSIFK